MKEAPLVSIVIAVFQTERFLSATLQSIRDQTMKDWECVVVDDGSKDGTAEIARRHAAEDSRIRVLSQQNAGICGARNRGFKETHPGSSYITFMDGDDVWLPDALESLVDALDASPQMIGAHGIADFIDQEGRPLLPGEFARVCRERIGFDVDGRMIPRPPSQPTSFDTLLLKNGAFPPGVVLTKREAFEKTGLFDDAMLLVEDWDMLIRLSRHGNYVFLDKIITLYRRHGANCSTRDDKANELAVRKLHYKTFHSRENNETQKKLVVSFWRAMQLTIIKQKFEAIRAEFTGGHVTHAMKTAAGLYVQLHRYLRGRPTLNGL
jgi:glycosyltransferase involved in cell wall biosynthesis